MSSSLRPMFTASVASMLALALASAARALVARHHDPWPVPVVDGWGSSGAIVVAGLALASVASFIAGRRVMDCRGSSRAAVISGTALFAGFAAACAVGNFSLSSDVYAYAAYGDLANSGHDPYVPVARGAHEDAFIAAAFAHWPDGLPPCVYGPLFVTEARAIVAVAGTLPATIAGFRIASVLSLAAAAVALGALRRTRRVESALLFASHPVVMWGAFEGHNDVTALAIALIGASIAARRSPLALAGVAVAACAIAFKASALLVLPFAVPIEASRRFRRVAAGIAIAAATAAAIVTLRAGWPAITHLAAHSHYAPAYSLEGLAVDALVHQIGSALPPATVHIAGTVIGLVPSLVFAIVAFATWRRPVVAGRLGGLADAVALLASALLLGLPNAQPWYGTWFAALAAGMLLRRDGSVSPAALGLWGATFSIVLRYLGDAAGPLDELSRTLLVAALAVPPAASLFRIKKVVS